MTTFKGNYTKYVSAGISLWDSKKLGFGSGSWATAGENASPDAEMTWDGTRLSIIPAVDDSVFRFGDMNAVGFDVQFSGTVAANYMEWDCSADALEFNGGGGITMGASTTIDATSGTVKGSDIIIPFVFSATDGGSVLAASGVLQSQFTVPFAMTINEVCFVAHGTVTTDGTSDITLQVLEGNTTILTGANIAIAATETPAVTAPTAGGIADNAIITVEVTSTGTGSSVAANSNDNSSITVVLTGVRA